MAVTVMTVEFGNIHHYSSLEENSEACLAFRHLPNIIFVIYLMYCYSPRCISWVCMYVYMYDIEINWNWIEMNWIELNWTELNWIELNWIELNWIELNWIELNWIELELNWSLFVQFFEQIQKFIEHYVNYDILV